MVLAMGIFLKKHTKAEGKYMLLEQIQQMVVYDYNKMEIIGMVASLIAFVVLFLILTRKARKRRRLLRLKLTQIDNLDGFDFEEYLFYKLKKEGYSVKLTSNSHDYGADLVLKKGRKKIVIQAKRWKGNVGISAVQEVVGAKSYYKAKYAMVITNSGFTRSAKDLANVNNVILWNRHTLKQWIEGKKFKQLWEETKDSVY